MFRGNIFVIGQTKVANEEDPTYAPLTYVCPMGIGGNACTCRSLKNGRLGASFPVTETLKPLQLWSKDFVQRAGTALSSKALKPGKPT